jgi:hypothetical protein
MITVDANRWYRINRPAQSVVPVEENYITRLARAFSADSAHGRFETATDTIYSVGARLTDVEIFWLTSDRSRSETQCPRCDSYHTDRAPDSTPQEPFYLCRQCGQRFRMVDQPPGGSWLV